MSESYHYKGSNLLKSKQKVEGSTSLLTEKKKRQLIQEGEVIVKDLLLKKAFEKGYKDERDETLGSIISACSYAGYPNPYQKESQKFIAWRGAVWAFLYNYIVEIEKGNQPMPASINEVISKLPVFETIEQD